jgi:hypothetical protein
MTTNQWIPVAAALPPIDERVLVAAGSWHVGRLVIDSHTGADWQVNEGGSWSFVEGVTHWMRPSSPVEG